ncbi:hypothetical protein IQ07DRAFT_69726 [Pyrenochaeta sp. DS3sAY3a]|nr:hypothetical protein IQ07DRAFT_69726 [Pyrenochaeta sp. DS3sAY3a]
MPPKHLSSTSQALYRVFIAPNPRPTTSIPKFYVPALTTYNASSRSPGILPHTSIRTKAYTKDTRRHAISDMFTVDSAIKADRINVVDQHGVFHRDVSLNEAFDSMDRLTYHLQQLTPGTVDEYGRANPDDLPTCRIVSKIDLRAKHRRKLDIERQQAKGQGTGPAPKSIELNWAIAEGDLKHRLDKLKEFLKEGRKVEIMLGQKKKGKKATEEEANRVMEKVMDAVGECKGAGKVKETGTVGAVFTVVFEGRKLDEKEGKKDKKKGENQELQTS